VNVYFIPPGPPDIGLASVVTVLKKFLNIFSKFSGKSENVIGCTEVMLRTLTAKAHRTINSTIFSFIIHRSHYHKNAEKDYRLIISI